MIGIQTVRTSINFIYSGTDIQILKISNKMTYHIPEKFAKIAAHKLQVLEANDVIITIVPNREGTSYYHRVLDGISCRL